MKVRILEAGDEPALEAFLRPRADSSMILRSNVRLAGVADGPGRFQGTYAAGFEGDDLVGVVAHYWNGNLIPQAGRGLTRLARAAVKASGRPFAGAVGPAEQVGRALSAFGVSEKQARADSREGLYALELSELRVPEMLRAQRISVRPVEPGDREQVVAWYDAYEVETLGAKPGTTRANSERRFDNACEGDVPAYVILRDGEPVACSGFNAVLPDAVQVGGVFTPPHERGKGFARGVVAQSLVLARERGVQRALLFTGDDNTPAIAAYTALGFQRVGDFRLTMLKKPVEVN